MVQTIRVHELSDVGSQYRMCPGDVQVMRYGRKYCTIEGIDRRGPVVCYSREGLVLAWGGAAVGRNELRYLVMYAVW